MGIIRTLSILFLVFFLESSYSQEPPDDLSPIAQDIWRAFIQKDTNFTGMAEFLLNTTTNITSSNDLFLNDYTRYYIEFFNHPQVKDILKKGYDAKLKHLEDIHQEVLGIPPNLEKGGQNSGIESQLEGNKYGFDFSIKQNSEKLINEVLHLPPETNIVERPFTYIEAQQAAFSELGITNLDQVTYPPSSNELKSMLISSELKALDQTFSQLGISPLKAEEQKREFLKKLAELENSTFREMNQDPSNASRKATKTAAKVAGEAVLKTAAFIALTEEFNITELNNEEKQAQFFSIFNPLVDDNLKKEEAKLFAAKDKYQTTVQKYLMQTKRERVPDDPNKAIERWLAKSRAETGEMVSYNLKKLFNLYSQIYPEKFKEKFKLIPLRPGLVGADFSFPDDTNLDELMESNSIGMEKINFNDANLEYTWAENTSYQGNRRPAKMILNVDGQKFIMMATAKDGSAIPDFPKLGEYKGFGFLIDDKMLASFDEGVSKLYVAIKALEDHLKYAGLFGWNAKYAISEAKGKKEIIYQKMKGYLDRQKSNNIIYSGSYYEEMMHYHYDDIMKKNPRNASHLYYEKVLYDYIKWWGWAHGDEKKGFNRNYWLERENKALQKIASGKAKNRNYRKTFDWHERNKAEKLRNTTTRNYRNGLASTDPDYHVNHPENLPDVVFYNYATQEDESISMGFAKTDDLHDLRARNLSQSTEGSKIRFWQEEPVPFTVKDGKQYAALPTPQGFTLNSLDEIYIFEQEGVKYTDDEGDERTRLVEKKRQLKRSEFEIKTDPFGNYVLVPKKKFQNGSYIMVNFTGHMEDANHAKTLKKFVEYNSITKQLIKDLEAAGAHLLAKDLITAFNVNGGKLNLWELESVFRESMRYTYVHPESKTTEKGVFAEFSGFVDEGRPCVQCDSGNEYIKIFLDTYFEQTKEVEIARMGGYKGVNGKLNYNAPHSWLQYIDYKSGYRVQIDGTPIRQDPRNKSKLDLINEELEKKQKAEAVFDPDDNFKQTVAEEKKATLRLLENAVERGILKPGEKEPIIVVYQTLNFVDQYNNGLIDENELITRLHTLHGVKVSTSSYEELANSLTKIFTKEQETFNILMEKFKMKAIRVRGLNHLKDSRVQAGFSQLVKRLATINSGYKISELLRKCISI